MASRLRSAFAKSGSLEPFYSGGAVAVTADGELLAATFGTEVLVIEARTARILHRLPGDGEDVLCLTLTRNDTHLITLSRSLALKFYALPEFALVRTVARAHDAPVAVMQVDPTSSLLATGSADGTVKVWDLAGAYCTHVFRGHGGVLSALCWIVQREQNVVRLATGCVDGKVRVWDLRASKQASSKPLAVLGAHAGVVRALGIAQDGTTLVSGARDQTLAIWNVRGDRFQRRELCTAGERIEALGFLDGHIFYTAGSGGRVRLWDADRAEPVYTPPTALDATAPEEQDEEDDELHGLTDALYAPQARAVVAVSASQELAYYTVERGARLALTRQLVGYNDEIVDLALVQGADNAACLAVAANNSELHVYRLGAQDHDVALLEGHRDVVLCLDASADKRWLASGAKDRTARIWAPSTDAAEGAAGRAAWRCLAVCEGHAESIGSVAFARRAEQSSPAPFLVTASQDRTVKVWDLSALSADAPAHPPSLATLKVHDKDINAIDVAPNNSLLLTGSQDRTARVFRLEYTPASRSQRAAAVLRPVATCKGHKRGVWSVAFSPTEQAFATASSDATVRLWSLRDYSCVRVFEGHTGGVLRTCFLPGGRQLASSASDGLVKLWNVREEQCAATLDAHDDKIWALAVRDAQGEQPLELISGGADSAVHFWADRTAAVEQERAAEQEETVHREQEFANLLVLRDYRNAIALAFAMDQPRRLLTLFAQVASQRADGDAAEGMDQLLADALGTAPAGAAQEAASITGLAAVDQIIAQLPHTQLVQLLTYIRDWNTTARHAPVAQLLLHAVVRLHHPETILDAFERGAGADAGKAPAGKPSLNAVLEALTPYTERHYARADRLLMESAMLDYTLQAMDSLVGEQMDEEPVTELPRRVPDRDAEEANGQEPAVGPDAASESDSGLEPMIEA